VIDGELGELIAGTREARTDQGEIIRHADKA